MNFDPNKLTPEQRKQAERLKEDAKKYQGKSEAELFKELEKMKRNGNITPQKMETFKRKVAPLLDEKQKKRLEVIIQKLK